MKIFCNILILSIVNIGLSKSSHRKDNDDKISEGDNIIKKILSADRFNDLADKIVDKAIWRLNHPNYTVEMEKHSSPEFKSTVDTTEVKSNKKVQKRHRSVINVDAVLKNKVIPFVDLSFRYDHFTRGLNTYTSSETKPLKKINDHNIDWSNESTDEKTIKQNIIKKVTSKNIDETQNKNEKDEKSHSDETVTLNEKLFTETSLDVTNFTNTEATTTSKIQSMENQFGDEKSIVWGEKDESGDKTSSDKSSEAKKTKDKKQVSGAPNKTYHNRASDGEEPSLFTYNNDNRLQNDEPLVKTGEIKQSQLEHEEKKKKTYHLLRREGDRTFAFEDSPDYVEYHEKLSEVRKKHSKNTEEQLI